TDFGLDVGRAGNVLSLKTFGHEQRWGSVIEGPRKQLHHLSFGCYAEDLSRLKSRIEGNGVVLLDPPAGFESNGFWFRDCDGVLIEIKVAPKSSPDHKASSVWSPSPPGVAAATLRGNAPRARPRRLSHALIFSSDIS